MRRTFSKKLFFLILLISLATAATLLAQSTDRFFDSANTFSNELKITALHPSIGTIKSIIELRKQNLLPSRDVIVVGVYHKKELTNYKKSKEFVRKNHLEWFKFHRLTCELRKDILFQKNPCTPEFEKIFKKSDGIIFFGGADIPPNLYREKTNLLTEIDTPYRSYLELSLIFHLVGGFQDTTFHAFLETNKEFPILGICLGCQSINVGTGGTLIQDIWSEIYGKKYLEDVLKLDPNNWHSNPFARLYPEEKLIHYTLHQIKLKENGKFCSVFGFKKEDTPYVLSSHHQMVNKTGRGIRIIATSLDGKVVEAIEHEYFPNVLGVQFHPESPYIWNPDIKVKTAPGDKEKRSLRSILEKDSTSFKFNKKIWEWFSKKLQKYHNIGLKYNYQGLYERLKPEFFLLLSLVILKFTTLLCSTLKFLACI